MIKYFKGSKKALARPGDQNGPSSPAGFAGEKKVRMARKKNDAFPCSMRKMAKRQSNCRQGKRRTRFQRPVEAQQKFEVQQKFEAQLLRRSKKTITRPGFYERKVRSAAKIRSVAKIRSAAKARSAAKIRSAAKVRKAAKIQSAAKI